MKKPLLIIGGLAALLVGIIAVAAVGAQEGTPEAKPTDEFIAKTAENLGISAEQLTAAMTDARNEMIDEAVAEGKITEERAAKLKERIAEKGPLSHPSLHREKHRGCFGARFMVTSAAAALDMDAKELAEALKSGQSLAAVAESKGMSVEDFKTALLAQVKAKLDAAVADGKLTQERADKVYAATEENIDRIINFVPDENGRCGGHGRGDRRLPKEEDAATPAP